MSATASWEAEEATLGRGVPSPRTRDSRGESQAEGRDLTLLNNFVVQVGSCKDRGKMGPGGSQIHVPLLEVGGQGDGSFMSPTGKKETRVSFRRLRKVRLTKRGQVGERGKLDGSSDRLWQV